MEIFYKLIEVTVTLIEDAIIISSVVAISGRRYAIKKHILCVLAAVAAMSLVVSGLNRIEMFSFITPILGMLIVLLISRFLSSGAAFASGDSMCYGLLCYPKYRLHPFYRNGVAAWHS